MTGAVTGERLMRLAIDVGEPVEVGMIGGRMRRYVPLGAGTVEGAYRGTIIAGGMDWQTVAPNGRLEIAARYVLELEEGRVEVRSEGLRAGPPEVLARLARGEPVEPGEYYFRTAMRFGTAAPALARLNDLIAIAVGERQARRVLLDVFPVL